MKTLKNTITILATTMFFFVSKGYAQDMNQFLSEITSTAVQTVFQPYADGFSANMNSGLFHTAKIEDGFSMYLGVKGSGTSMTSDEKALFGDALPMNLIPYGTPQLNIGSVYGTDVMVRYLPEIKLGKYGSVSSWGTGIRHSISSHIKDCPVDMSVQFAYMNLKVNDSKGQTLLNTSSTAANFQLSKELAGFFTIYTGVQYENTKMNLHYNYQNTIDVNASFENSSKIKGIVGINLGLGPININGDCNFGSRTTFSAGFGLSF